MNDLLTFRRMITPVIIQILFWIFLVVVVISGLIALGQGAVLQGLLMIFLGPIMVRVYCEILIIVFKMHATLVEIRNNTAR